MTLIDTFVRESAVRPI